MQVSHDISHIIFKARLSSSEIRQKIFKYVLDFWRINQYFKFIYIHSYSLVSDIRKAKA